MQVYNKEEQILRAKEWTSEFQEEEMKKEEVNHIVVGKMPEVGDEIHLNGLVFVVKSIKTRGRINLKLKGYIK